MNAVTGKASSAALPDVDVHPRRVPLLAKLGRKLLFSQLGRIEHGELRFIEGGAVHRFGSPTAKCALQATIVVHHAQLYADVAFGGTVGAGEAYIRGLWRCDDLVALVRIFVVNRELMMGLDSRWASFRLLFLKLFHFWNRNSRAGSARNIAAHYDIGNELYELMLDDTMAYSCGIFRTAGSSLRDASIEKFDVACRKLDLKPSDHLLEIGTGWGGLALHAACNYGCRVTTTTISRQQYEWAKAKVAERGLGDRVTVLLQDYRDLEGRYDKLVSIEMIEAVGARYLDTYLAKCSGLLEADGAMLLQAITIRDQLYEQVLRSVDFIQRFIFPGSFIPSIGAISRSLTAVTDLKMFDLAEIGPDYATTLRLWRQRFFAAIDAVRGHGYSESFIRLWEFYLCYCEGGFLERQLGTVQMLLTKPDNRRPVLPG